MQAGVILFPGSNCERDAAEALRLVTGKPARIIWHADTQLPKLDLIILPGGFSYGDYLRTGAMAAHSPIMREVVAQAKKGVRVLGICNGFQMLCETQLVPGVLLRNKSLKFISKPVDLRVESTASDFTRKLAKGQQIRVPIAHGEGNYFASDDVIKQLQDGDRIAFRYVENPNGSKDDIAGIFNESRTVLGMMPHPERVVEPVHGCTDGAKIFESLLAA